MQQHFNLGRIPMKARLFIADVFDGLAGHGDNHIIGDGLRPTHFTTNHHTVGGGKGFTAKTHTRRIHLFGQSLTEKKIHDLIRNPVTDFVWMAF